MEREGLVACRRDPDNRRTQVVELTVLGEAAFARIRSAAGAFDSMLRRGLSDEEARRLELVLRVLVANATACSTPASRSESTYWARTPPEGAT